jgi:hypothetical protein
MIKWLAVAWLICFALMLLVFRIAIRNPEV